MDESRRVAKDVASPARWQEVGRGVTAGLAPVLAVSQAQMLDRPAQGRLLGEAEGGLVQQRRRVFAGVAVPVGRQTQVRAVVPCAELMAAVDERRHLLAGDAPEDLRAELPVGDGRVEHEPTHDFDHLDGASPGFLAGPQQGLTTLLGLGMDTGDELVLDLDLKQKPRPRDRFGDDPGVDQLDLTADRGDPGRGGRGRSRRRSHRRPRRRPPPPRSPCPAAARRPNSPSRIFQSAGLTPQACTTTRIWSGPGWGSGTSARRRTSGPPNSLNRTALIMVPLVFVASRLNCATGRG